MSRLELPFLTCVSLQTSHYRRHVIKLFVQTAKINFRKNFYLEPSAKFISRETYFFSHPQNLIPAKFKNEASQPQNLIPANLVPAKISSFKVIICPI